MAFFKVCTRPAVGTLACTRCVSGSRCLCALHSQARFPSAKRTAASAMALVAVFEDIEVELRAILLSIHGRHAMQSCLLHRRKQGLATLSALLSDSPAILV